MSNFSDEFHDWYIPEELDNAYSIIESSPHQGFNSATLGEPSPGRGAGKNVKYTRSTRWYTIAGIDQDYTTSLGRHQMSTSTTVIARPYPNGHTYLQYEQVAYFYDHYDFGPGEPEYGGRQRECSELAHQAMLYGIAKPFEVQGESTPMSGFETR